MHASHSLYFTGERKTEIVLRKPLSPRYYQETSK